MPIKQYQNHLFISSKTYNLIKNKKAYIKLKTATKTILLPRLTIKNRNYFLSDTTVDNIFQINIIDNELYKNIINENSEKEWELINL